MQRFWDKVDQAAGPDGCWPWTAFTDDGYGKFRIDGRTVGAHRIAYELTTGALCPSDDVHHTCTNRACVNPAHLVKVAHDQHRRLEKAAQTTCRNGHPLSGENLYVYPDGRRQCRTCSTRSKRTYRERKAAK